MTNLSKLSEPSESYLSEGPHDTDISFFLSSVDMWYLHGPDRATPYEVTLRAVNELYEEGKFKRFGISNYYSQVPIGCYLRSHF